MKKNLLTVLMILFVFFAVLLNAEEDLFRFLPADEVVLMNNRDYTPVLVNLIDSAKISVHAIIYATGYYPDYPDGVTTDLQNALINCSKRGVEVTLIIDQSSWNPSQSVKNEDYANFMNDNGVTVYFDPPDITTHTKVVIVDSLYTVVGSTNWSFFALANNNECAVGVKSRELNAVYENIFNQLLMFKSDTLTIQP